MPAFGVPAQPPIPHAALRDNRGMISRLPLLLAIAGSAVLFLAIAFVYVLVIGAIFFGGIEFTGGSMDAALPVPSIPSLI